MSEHELESMNTGNETEPKKEPRADTKLEDLDLNRSAVSNGSPFKRNTALINWIVAIVIAAIVLMMWLSSGSKKTSQPATPQTIQNTQDYNTELRENIEKLNAQMKRVHVAQKKFQTFTAHATDSKEMKARENQPASMYSASPPSGGNSATLEATHAQEGPFVATGANAAFGNHSSDTTTVSATHIAHPYYTIASGEFIHAVLETAINSDLPGMVRAVISEPVYAYVGERPLVPAGSRLIGQYSSSLLQGQNRVMIVWNRIILPNGVAVQVNSPGADNLGRAGQGADSVDSHFFARFGEASLLSLIGAGAANTGVNSDVQYNSAAQYRMAVAQSFQQSAQGALQNSLPQKPTLRIYQGARVNVFVAHDLSFYQVLHAQAESEFDAGDSDSEPYYNK